jgi:hypothetical protein
MPNSQSITRLTNDQRDRMARLLTAADIPVNNDDSIPLGDINPVSRRNINENLVNNLINNDNLRQNPPVNNLINNNNLRQNPPVNNNLANIPGDDEDLYSGGRRRNKKTRKSRKKRKNKSNKSKKSKKRRTRKY